MTSRLATGPLFRAGSSIIFRLGPLRDGPAPPRPGREEGPPLGPAPLMTLEDDAGALSRLASYRIVVSRIQTMKTQRETSGKLGNVRREVAERAGDCASTT